MIKLSLKCDQDHQFESWFASTGAFDSLKTAGHVTCAVCGSPDVSKAMMAPRVSTTKGKDVVPTAPPQPDDTTALQDLKKHVEWPSNIAMQGTASQPQVVQVGMIWSP